MKKLLISSAAIVSLGIASASAADLPLIPQPPLFAPAPVLVPIGNWTGWYIGGNVGYGWSNANTTISSVAGALAGVAIGAIPTNFLNGAVGGFQLGYNYQLSPSWVVGAETDFSFSRVRGSEALTGAGFFPLTGSISQDLDWFGTIRGRLGYAVDSWLFYGTGGGAYGHVQYDEQSNSPAGPISIIATDSAMQWGWTAGGGIEYGFGQWTTRVEYLYMDLGDHSFNVPLNTVPSAILAPNFESRFQVVRAGLNYRF